MNEEDFITRILAEAKRDREEYTVYSGSRVLMSDGAEYIVALTILGDDLRKQLSPDGSVWKLFSLVHIRSGVNYAHPVPVMSEGTVDIRKLMQVGTHPIKSVVYDSGTAEKRVYWVVDESGYVNEITVTR